jgi:hypothetical protein
MNYYILLKKYNMPRLFKILSLFITISFGVYGFPNKRFMKNTNTQMFKPRPSPNTLLKPTFDFDYHQTWDDGEVEWVFENENTDYEPIEKRPPSPAPKIETERSVREKIWGLVEEVRIQGGLSGIINVAYYNNMVSDNIVNDVQNFAIAKNLDFVTTLNHNHGQEFDLILYILTFIGYNNHKKGKINKLMNGFEKNNNNYFVEQYQKQRSMAAMVTIIFLIVFFKSVKSVT